ncbi:MAG: cyclopropane fatty acyl phospholipid synthase [Pseudomonadota bacterium]
MQSILKNLAEPQFLATGYKSRLQGLLDHADVSIDGERPWDIQVHNDALYGRVFGEGSLGLGEAYMDGWWDCEHLDQFFTRVLQADLGKKITTWSDKLFFLSAYLWNLQNRRRSPYIAKQHYNIGNDLYQQMLDERMIYSCGYWREAKTLDEAQEAKLDLVCRKLGLQPGMRVLDIGCGWGGAARYAAENYGVEVVGITIAKEQVTMAEEVCAGLPVEIRLQDYRDINERFDRIYSLGMFEHVGFKNYRRYFEVVNRCLDDKGLFLLHSIGFKITSNRLDPWVRKYIFANSITPSVKLIGEASEGLLIMEDWHNFRHDYDRTLLEWHGKFNQNWANLENNYDERFRRMWNFYLLGAAGTFRSCRSQLWQIVFSKSGLKQGYLSIR